MFQESLEKFVHEQFLRPGSTQDALKATESFDDFVTLMVRLGNDQGYSFTAEEVQALVMNEINKQKATMDDIGQGQLDREMATHWRGGDFVGIGIVILRRDDVYPLYP